MKTVVSPSRKSVGRTMAVLNAERPVIPHWFLFITGDSFQNVRPPEVSFPRWASTWASTWALPTIVLATILILLTVIIRSNTELLRSQSQLESAKSTVERLRKGQTPLVDDVDAQTGRDPGQAKSRFLLILYSVSVFAGSFAIVTVCLRKYAFTGLIQSTVSPDASPTKSTEGTSTTDLEVAKLGFLLLVGILLASGFVFAGVRHFAAMRIGYETERLRREASQLETDLAKNSAVKRSQPRADFEIVIPLPASTPRLTGQNSAAPLSKVLLKPLIESRGVLFWSAFIGLVLAVGYRLLLTDVK